MMKTGWMGEQRNSIKKQEQEREQQKKEKTTGLKIMDEQESDNTVK